MEQFLQNKLQNSQDAFQNGKKFHLKKDKNILLQLSEILNDRKNKNLRNHYQRNE